MFSVIAAPWAFLSPAFKRASSRRALPGILAPARAGGEPLNECGRSPAAQAATDLREQPASWAASSWVIPSSRASGASSIVSLSYMRTSDPDLPVQLFVRIP